METAQVKKTIKPNNFNSILETMKAGKNTGSHIFKTLSSYTYPLAPPVLINITEGLILTELRVNYSKNNF